MKLCKITCLLLVAALLCGTGVAADETVPPEGIKIVLTKTEMRVGETQKIKVSVTPANTENYSLEYASSNPEVITAAIGTIIANKEGTADITVKIKDTDISDTVTVTVKKDTSTVLVSDIKLEDTVLYIGQYEEQRIYYTIIPSTASNKNVNFVSQNTAVALVNEKGVVYGKKAGNTQIQVQSSDGKVTKYVKVYVPDEDEVTESDSDIPVRNVDIYNGEDEVTKTIEVMRTQTVKFTTEISPDSATDKRIRWKSADEDIAEVDENGVVTGISEESVKIYAIARDNGRQDVITVKVIPYVRYPDSISITPQDNAVYETGQVIAFTPVFSPADTTEKNLKWFVSGNNVEIDQNGNVTITHKGTATVKAYTEDFKLSAEYTFEAVFNKAHFTQTGKSYNVKSNRPVIVTFDEAVSITSANSNIFAASDETGNTNPIDIMVTVLDRQVIITPVNSWSMDGCYIFIKENICDTQGNRLGKNLKYKIVNVRSEKREKN